MQPTQLKTRFGQGRHPEKFSFQKAEQQIEKVTQLWPVLSEIEKIPYDELSDQDIINRSIKVLQLKNEISTIAYKTYLIPFNSEGGFFNSPAFFLPNSSFQFQGRLSCLYKMACHISGLLILQSGFDETRDE